MRALVRERGRPPQGALPLLTWLAPFLSSCLSSSCWTNDRVRETLLVRQRPQKSRQRLVLERHPCPEQPPPSECPSQPGWVSAASETRVLPVPPLCKPPPDNREGEASCQTPPPAADTHLNAQIMFPREVLCLGQPLALSVYPPASAAGRGGEEPLPAFLEATGCSLSKALMFGFLVLP